MTLKPLKVLIVEDEVLIAETIKMYLEERGHSTTDTVISHDEALHSIHTVIPDLVLIDIRLYGQKSGIDLAEELSKSTYNIPFIFLTSQYDSRILNKAIELQPMGYLIKPIQKETLWTTIELAFYNFNVAEEDNKIKIIDGALTHLIQKDDILYISSDHIYINIHTQSSGVVIVRMPLSELHQKLDQNQFIHCHRSYIVNIKHISRYDYNSFTVNNVTIPISRSNKNEIKSLFEKGNKK